MNTYTTKDILKKIGISRNTLFLWFKSGKVVDVSQRDRNNNRIYTDEDISRIIAFKNKVIRADRIKT